MSKEYLVYSCPTMLDKAQYICEHNNWKLMNINWGKFPDGTPNLFVEGIPHETEGKHVLFLSDFYGDKRFSQNCVMVALAESFIESFTILLPFMPTATMERVSVEGQIATARIDAHFLSNLPRPHGSSYTKVIVYDLHTEQNRFYVQDRAMLRMASAVNLVTSYIKSDTVIAFPDAGACKRYGGLFTSYNQITCGKIRDGDKRIVHIKEGDPLDKEILIVDDLVQSGGTLIECARVLQEQGAKKVDCYVTHVVFPKKSYERFMKEDCPISTFFHTDTIPTTCSKIAGIKPFVCIPIHDDVIKYL